MSDRDSVDEPYTDLIFNAWRTLDIYNEQSKADHKWIYGENDSSSSYSSNDDPNTVHPWDPGGVNGIEDYT